MRMWNNILVLICRNTNLSQQHYGKRNLVAPAEVTNIMPYNHSPKNPTNTEFADPSRELYILIII